MVRVSEQLIEEMVRTIVDEVGPRRIYLFGSHTRGSQTTDSDIDLLIVEDQRFGPDRNRWSELKRIRKALKLFRIPKEESVPISVGGSMTTPCLRAYALLAFMATV